jgi:Rne/Rng family ribonuclease
MNKELFVSTTPHETKVGITEDDQLAEIYLERENEYTLAGSIYKGRVTRVLPGMQSAFVDIGLERDAFLYVSDFMDLEQQDEDLDEAIPANRPANDSRPPRRGSESSSGSGGRLAESGIASNGGSDSEATSSASPGNGTDSSRDLRGRRRRRGRRGETGRRPNGDRAALPDSGGPEGSEGVTEAHAGPPDETRSEPISILETRQETRTEPRSGHRGEGRHDRSGRSDRSSRGGSDSRFQRPARTTPVGQDYDYGPPPGYTPIVLPGESISKYQRQGQSPSQSSEEHSPQSDEGFSQSEKAHFEQSAPATTSIRSNFPDDEPIFAVEVSESRVDQFDNSRHVDEREEIGGAATSSTSDIAEFRNDPTLDSYRTSEDMQPEVSAKERVTHQLSGHESDQSAAHDAIFVTAPQIAHGAVEEQEIEDEEADLTSYGEEPGDDDGFEELEEETRAADAELPEARVEESGEGNEAGHGEFAPDLAAGGEAALNGEAVPEAVLEAEEREAADLELEEAQAEAEALLEAEAIGDGTVDASAAVRSPAPEARLLQRTQRRGPDRGSDRNSDRGRGRRGGRRFSSRENQVVPQISELLKEGQEVLIQIAKEPIAKKGARITSHIALPGRFLVFMPTVNHTGVSRKIASEEERQRLKRIIQSERENGAGGFIVRTAAAGASDEELRADIRFLKNLWNEIKARSETSKAPALIYHDLNVVERVLRDQVSSDFSVIWVDTEQEYERILRFANRFQPGLVKRVKLYTKETPLYDQFGLNEEINKALKSKVWLKSGGYIVINQTEALVAIDVNTGKYVGKTARLEDTIVKTNVDAIKEIVRQVRLRDLGGIIIIDFIDMDERRNRQKVMQALEEALRLDRAPSKVLQFNDFGLVAITRKRVKQSLERTIGSPCPYCQSTGFVKSVSTICNEIYVEMRKISSHLEHSDVMLRVNPEVAKQLKVGNAKLLGEMEELTKKTIIIKSDPALHQEQFDIH